MDIVGQPQSLGKPAGLDLKNGNLTAPLLFALNESQILRKLVEREFSEDADLENGIKIIKSTGGIKQATDLAIEHAQTAIEHIKDYKDGESINDLKKLNSFIIHRIN